MPSPFLLSCNQPKSLSGIETRNNRSLLPSVLWVAINLNPYQGLKPEQLIEHQIDLIVLQLT